MKMMRAITVEPMIILNTPISLPTVWVKIGLVWILIAVGARMTTAQADVDSDKTYRLTWSTSVSSYSPTLSIHQFVDDWNEPLDSGDMAFVQGRTSIDYQTANSNLGYGLAMRYDYLLKFNEPTAQVYWRYKNDQALEDDKNYPLSIEAQHTQRFGSNMFANFPVNLPVGSNWTATPRVNIWKGVHAVDGAFLGNISTLKSQSSNMKDSRLLDQLSTASASLNYHYDEPTLQEDRIGWNPSEPQGYGYSLDIAIDGKVTEKTHASVQAFDVLGKMYWQDMPMTRYELDYDVAGRPLYTLEGQLDTEDFQQKLPWRVESNITHKLTDKWQVAVASQINDVSDLHQLSATYQTGVGAYPLAVSGIIEPQTESFGLAVDSEHIGVKWLTDDIDTNQAKRGDVQLYLDYQW